MKTFISRSAAETRQIAQRLAKNLKGDGVVLLSGELGAGKTEFVKGLASALGIKAKITSPTFLLHRTYPFKKKKKSWSLHHFDLYRLSKKTKLESLGLFEVLQEKYRIVAIEWPGRVKILEKILQKRPTYINFAHGTNPNSRKIKISN